MVEQVALAEDFPGAPLRGERHPQPRRHQARRHDGCRSWWRRIVLFRVARFRRVLARPLPDGAAPQSRALLDNAGTRTVGRRHLASPRRTTSNCH